MGLGLVREFGSGGGGGAASATVVNKTLAASTTSVTATPPSSSGQLLIVQITQSSGGGDQITWDTTSASKFETGIPVDINPAGSSVTRFLFFANGGNWCFLSITLL